MYGVFIFYMDRFKESYPEESLDILDRFAGKDTILFINEDRISFQHKAV